MGILYSAYDILKQENNDESVKLDRGHMQKYTCLIKKARRNPSFL